MPASARKKQSRKSPSKAGSSAPASKSQPSARITNNATTSHSHTVELPTSHLPFYVVPKAQSETAATQTALPGADIPCVLSYLEHAGLYTATSATVPVCGAPTSASPSGRDAVLGDIDFVQTLSSKLAPPSSTSPKGPTEAEKKIQAEVQRLGDILKQKERDEEIAAAVAKGKAEGKAEMVKSEKAADASKTREQSRSCTAGMCACGSGNVGLRKTDGQDGFVFHLHKHQNGTPPSGSDVFSGGVGYVDATGTGVYEARRGSLGEVAVGYARRMMDKMRHIEARTSLLETEIEMGWERDAERERRRLWERERERYGYPATAWGRGYL